MNAPATLAALALLLAAPATAAPRSYTIDPDHTYPSFEADHMGISMWRGKLNRSAGRIVLDREAGSGRVEVTVDLASIDFGQDALNEWARGKDFFEVASHPTARFEGELRDFVDGTPRRVVGTLTLHGKTGPMTLAIARLKCMPHPMTKRELCGAYASGTFQRDAFGLTAGKDYGFDMSVALRIQVEAVVDD
jgi:polyisoprenoid-binding protein YceI